MRELILGGQKSGKSRLAEERARAWLSQSPQHRAVLIATALAHDEEMAQRIARHQADRRERLPEMRCVEEPGELGRCLIDNSDTQTLVIVDCLTLWLTQLLMPPEGALFMQKQHFAHMDTAQSATKFIASLLDALSQVRGPVVLVSNEIGLGVIPMGAELRHFVDELGQLNQAVALRCERATLMAAGCALVLKEA